MNEVRKLHKFLLNAFPDARVTLDEPAAANGVWSLNLFRQGYHLAAAWKEGQGFGLVSDDDHGYGEGADEVFDDLEQALPRVVRLVTYRLGTAPPAVRLRELREGLGLSQEELGRRLGRGQASVSRAEARSDFHVSTLSEFARAMGARLVVKMVFPDSTEKELELEATR